MLKKKAKLRLVAVIFINTLHSGLEQVQRLGIFFVEDNLVLFLSSPIGFPDTTPRSDVVYRIRNKP